MKTQNELFIDKYLVKPVAFFLNYFVIILGKILSIDHSLDRKFKRIVICKFKGLGSIMQSTPMIESIKILQPEAKIIFVTTKSNELFLKKIDLIDEIIVINDKNALTLIQTLISGLFNLIYSRPCVYIDLEIYSNFSTIVALFSLSKNRIGFYLRSSSYRMGIYTHMMFFNSKVPVSDVYLQIARLFGPIKHKPNLYPIYKNCQTAPLFLPQKTYLVINPNASDLRIERRWHKNNFKDLILKLTNLFPQIEIILIGSKGEQGYVTELLEGLDLHNVKNLAGKTTIDELIALIKNAKVVITNDTGPMHLSFACKTPTICLFGPCSPEQYAVNENAYVFFKKVYCSPCVHEFTIPPCGGNNVCMKLITVNEVLEVIVKYLNNEIQLKTETTNSTPIVYQEDNEVLGLVVRTLKNWS